MRQQTKVQANGKYYLSCIEAIAPATTHPSASTCFVCRDDFAEDAADAYNTEPRSPSSILSIIAQCPRLRWFNYNRMTLVAVSPRRDDPPTRFCLRSAYINTAGGMTVLETIPDHDWQADFEQRETIDLTDYPGEDSDDEDEEIGSQAGEPTEEQVAASARRLEYLYEKLDDRVEGLGLRRTEIDLVRLANILLARSTRDLRPITSIRLERQTPLAVHDLLHLLTHAPGLGMLSVWPTKYLGESASAFTFDSLPLIVRAVATSAPHLKHLDLAVDPTSTPSVLAPMGTDFAPVNLEKLDLRLELVLADDREAHAFLQADHKLFPWISVACLVLRHTTPDVNVHFTLDIRCPALRQFPNRQQSYMVAQMAKPAIDASAFVWYLNRSVRRVRL